MNFSAKHSATHYETSPVETVLNALILGTFVVTCAVSVALTGFPGVLA